jgi:Fe2+ or Zn2+ uptake regulation protein
MPNPSEQAQFAYIATCPHGIVMFWCVDEGAVISIHAEEIVDMMKRGYKLDRLPDDEARIKAATSGVCQKCRAAKRKALESL